MIDRMDNLLGKISPAILFLEKYQKGRLRVMRNFKNSCHRQKSRLAIEARERGENISV